MIRSLNNHYMPGPSFVHGMGYMANQLGDYSAGQYNTSAPMSDAGDVNALMADGFDSGDAGIINSIYQAGQLTAQDWTMLLNDDIDATTLLTDITNTPGVSATGAATSTAASSGQSPSGSTLLYRVSWTAGIGNLTESANAAIAAITGALSSYGMSVVSSSVTSAGPINYGIQLQIHDSIGHALISDVQSVLHSLAVSAVGNNLSGESISLTAAGGSSSSTAAPAAGVMSSAETFVENNAVLIFAGVAALLILPALVKKL